MRWASRNEEGERRWMSVTGQERAAGCRASTATTEEGGSWGRRRQRGFERLTGLQTENNMHGSLERFINPLSLSIDSSARTVLDL